MLQGLSGMGILLVPADSLRPHMSALAVPTLQYLRSRSRVETGIDDAGKTSIKTLPS